MSDLPTLGRPESTVDRSDILGLTVVYPVVFFLNKPRRRVKSLRLWSQKRQLYHVHKGKQRGMPPFGIEIRNWFTKKTSTSMQRKLLLC
ncbi:hypothetical protein K0M31_010674 [Melipona bicolor]|uniref:Uncharacterized protein n=1 Tax=Melipona bicolor TaxID=60889 RepID=A0AA40FLQ2_9HYME|nr:hypothetical protein K0M31_010674 [Melipona bicolor]